MFKPADHTRRLPAVLQSHTKENVVAQLALTATMLAVMWAVDTYQERQLKKLYQDIDTPKV